MQIVAPIPKQTIIYRYSLFFLMFIEIYFFCGGGAPKFPSLEIYIFFLRGGTSNFLSLRFVFDFSSLTLTNWRTLQLYDWIDQVRQIQWKKRRHSLASRLAGWGYNKGKERDKWHVTCDTWHVTCDMWHGGKPFSQNFSSLSLTVCDLWYFYILEEKADWMIE